MRTSRDSARGVRAAVVDKLEDRLGELKEAFREGSPAFHPKDAFASARARAARISPFKVIGVTIVLGLVTGLFLVVLGSSTNSPSARLGADDAPATLAAQTEVYVPYTVAGDVPSSEGDRGVLPSPLPEAAQDTDPALPRTDSAPDALTDGVEASPPEAAPPAVFTFAPDSAEAAMLVYLNEERASRGAPPLEPDASLTASAGSHTAHMATSGSLCHSSECNLSGRPDASEFASWGENIGWIDRVDIAALHAAFMDSTPHRTNLLNSTWRYVGIAWAPGHLGPSGKAVWFMTVQFAA